MLIAFVIWSVVAVIFVGIGLNSWKSEEVVGFFTFAEPPVVTNVKGYNHTVAVLWIIVAVVLELLGIPLLFAEQNSPVYLVIILGVIALVIEMISVYIRIEMKYRKPLKGA